MLKRRIFLLVLVLATYSAQGDGGSPSGLYQITSGRYVACCGLAGAIGQSLPNESQSFIQLAIDPQENIATMAVLGADRRTVFSVFSCEFENPLRFQFDYGSVFSNRIVFHVDPGPPPSQAWNYTISNSIDSLRMDGNLGIIPHFCADSPTQFSHSNVIATKLPPAPVIEGLEREGDHLRFQFQGEPPNDYFVEFAKSLPATNWLSLTNVRVKLQPIVAVITDSVTNGAARYYRLRKEDCQCD